MPSGSTVATLYPSPHRRPPGRPELRLVGPPPPTFWFRRVAVLLAALLLVAGVGGLGGNGSSVCRVWGTGLGPAPQISVS
jgi:hypothetical protein